MLQITDYVSNNKNNDTNLYLSIYLYYYWQSMTFQQDRQGETQLLL